MTSSLQSTVRLFADDTIAYLTISSEQDALCLQSDLDKLAEWEKNWRMSFYPDKCNVLSITRSRTPKIYRYKLHGHTLQHVNSAKYLGITLSTDLRWEKHITNMCDKAINTLSFLHRNLKCGAMIYKIQNNLVAIDPSNKLLLILWLFGHLKGRRYICTGHQCNRSHI